MGATPLNAIPCNSIYYENDKKRLREQARDKYRKLFEEDKIKMREYKRNRYHNMLEEDKQKLKEYQSKSSLNLIINIFHVFNSVCYDLVIHY